MGRHSSPNQGPFLKSFLGWLSLWALVATVAGVFVWVVVSTVAGTEVRRPALAREQSKETPRDHVKGTRVSQIPTTPVPVETPAPTPGAELEAEGVTVQILNGTMKPDAGQGMAAKLSDLGYTVVAVEESSRVYSETTVFWSTDSTESDARALADRFGWVAEPKPGNLSDTVSIHVVVGADEARL